MRRILMLGMTLAAIAGAPLTAENRYVAIGDSVTAGSSWPATCGICPIVFDCTTVSCAEAPQNKRDKCGYVGRLDTWLGPGNYVKNEGKGGYETAQSLSEFEYDMNTNCEGAPGECVAVLLMHGTNDMANGMISPESARDNLSDMIDMAKEYNVDVLLMSIVRKVYDMTNTKWQDYRNLVLALAAAKNLQSVDPWTPLCSDNWACYNKNYWVDQANSVPQGPIDCTDPGEGDNNLGHLDPDGYGVLFNRVKLAFPASVPGAPSSTSPMGNIGDATPDFVWSNVATARWYQLQVDGALTWWEGAEICSGGTCTANPGVTLANGSHTWRVRGRNLRGQGAFSAVKGFDVGIDPPPAPTPTGPTGDYFEHAPRYEWQPAAGATEYDLEVKDLAGHVDFQVSGLLASSVCAGGGCSYVGTPLSTPDVYTFNAVGRNSGGEGPWSMPGVDFTIIECEDETPRNLHDLQPSPIVAPPKEVVYCGALEAPGPTTYTVEPSGDLTVHTRDGLTLKDGFTVKGTLTVKSP